MDSELEVLQFLRERLPLLTSEAHCACRSAAYDVRSCPSSKEASSHCLKLHVTSNLLYAELTMHASVPPMRYTLCKVRGQLVSAGFLFLFLMQSFNIGLLKYSR